MLSAPLSNETKAMPTTPHTAIVATGTASSALVTTANKKKKAKPKQKKRCAQYAPSTPTKTSSSHDERGGDEKDNGGFIPKKFPIVTALLILSCLLSTVGSSVAVAAAVGASARCAGGSRVDDDGNFHRQKQQPPPDHNTYNNNQHNNNNFHSFFEFLKHSLLDNAFVNYNNIGSSGSNGGRGGGGGDGDGSRTGYIGTPHHPSLMAGGQALGSLPLRASTDDDDDEDEEEDDILTMMNANSKALVTTIPSAASSSSALSASEEMQQQQRRYKKLRQLMRRTMAGPFCAVTFVYEAHTTPIATADNDDANNGNVDDDTLLMMPNDENINTNTNVNNSTNTKKRSSASFFPRRPLPPTVEMPLYQIAVPCGADAPLSRLFGSKNVQQQTTSHRPSPTTDGSSASAAVDAEAALNVLFAPFSASRASTAADAPPSQHTALPLPSSAPASEDANNSNKQRVTIIASFNGEVRRLDSHMFISTEGLCEGDECANTLGGGAAADGAAHTSSSPSLNEMSLTREEMHALATVFSQMQKEDIDALTTTFLEKWIHAQVAEGQAAAAAEDMEQGTEEADTTKENQQLQSLQLRRSPSASSEIPMLSLTSDLSNFIHSMQVVAAIASSSIIASSASSSVGFAGASAAAAAAPVVLTTASGTTIVFESPFTVRATTADGTTIKIKFIATDCMPLSNGSSRSVPVAVRALMGEGGGEGLMNGTAPTSGQRSASTTTTATSASEDDTTEEQEEALSSIRTASGAMSSHGVTTAASSSASSASSCAPSSTAKQPSSAHPPRHPFSRGSRVLRPTLAPVVTAAVLDRQVPLGVDVPKAAARLFVGQTPKKNVETTLLSWLSYVAPSLVVRRVQPMTKKATTGVTAAAIGGGAQCTGGSNIYFEDAMHAAAAMALHKRSYFDIITVNDKDGALNTGKSKPSSPTALQQQPQSSASAAAVGGGGGGPTTSWFGFWALDNIDDYGASPQHNQNDCEPVAAQQQRSFFREFAHIRQQDSNRGRYRDWVCLNEVNVEAPTNDERTRSGVVASTISATNTNPKRITLTTRTAVDGGHTASSACQPTQQPSHTTSPQREGQQLANGRFAD